MASKPTKRKQKVKKFPSIKSKTYTYRGVNYCLILKRDGRYLCENVSISSDLGEFEPYYDKTDSVEDYIIKCHKKLKEAVDNYFMFKTIKNSDMLKLKASLDGNK